MPSISIRTEALGGKNSMADPQHMAWESEVKLKLTGGKRLTSMLQVNSRILRRISTTASARPLNELNMAKGYSMFKKVLFFK